MIKKAPPKVRTSFRLPKETVSQLNKLEIVLNMPASTILEHLIEQEYEEAKKEYPREFQQFLII